MGCKSSRVNEPPAYDLSKTELEAAEALKAERDWLWRGSFHTYDEIFLMFPSLEMGSWPVLNLNKRVYDAAMRYYKAKDPVHAPDQQLMFTMYKTMLAQHKKKRR